MARSQGQPSLGQEGMVEWSLASVTQENPVVGASSRWDVLSERVAQILSESSYPAL